MASERIRVVGLSKLGDAMKALKGDAALRMARSMTNAGAQVVKKAAVVKAPKYPKAHTLYERGEKVRIEPGNLKKNVVVKRSKDKSLTSVHIVTVRGKRKDNYAARYGRLVEHGTVHSNAEPFMRPAFDENIHTAINAMQSSGSKALIREVKKGNIG